MVAFVHVLTQHKKVNRYESQLEVKYGDYDWIDAINFIFSQDGNGRGGVLERLLNSRNALY